MEIIIVVAIFVWYLAYQQYEGKKEKALLIREITTAVKAGNIVEYADNLPEYGKEDEAVLEEKDELISMEDVEPGDLLRAIKKIN